MLESAHAIKHGSLIDLSEQFLVDCSSSNYGCNGGSMQLALNYIQNNKTVYENHHPYKAIDQQCPNLSASYNITGWNNLSRMNLLDFLKALKERPITIAYHASNFSYSYAGGIIQESN